MNVDIGSWKPYLAEEFEKPYMKELSSFLHEEKQKGVTVYPRMKDVFQALKKTPIEKVKVVILGQDPYHGPNQAMGLSFSVPQGIALPPSLRNIYKELLNEYPEKEIPGDSEGKPNGDLSSWAEQGVLLLNTTLTVRASQAASHSNKGWEQFTDEIIRVINRECEGVIFLLWGAHAQKKIGMIDESKHHILKSVHPSPLSAHRGFFGTGHFTRINDILEESGRDPIQWL